MEGNDTESIEEKNAIFSFQSFFTSTNTEIPSKKVIKGVKVLITISDLPSSKRIDPSKIFHNGGLEKLLYRSLLPE